MREEGSNDVTIFKSSRYLYVGAGLVVCQMSVNHVQYLLIFLSFFRSSVVISFRFTRLLGNNSHNPVVPLNSFPLNVISLSVSTSTVESPILNESLSFLIPFSVEIAAFVEIWKYVPTSYGADILPTERPCIFLDKTSSSSSSSSS